MITQATYRLVRISTIKALEQLTTKKSLAPLLASTSVILIDLKGSINYWLWDSGVRIYWDSGDPLAT